jgi:hypothetical protein
MIPVLRNRKALLIGVAVAVLFLMALGVWRFRENSRRSVRQTLCVHNLKFLSMSLHTYADKHDGRFPDRLSELWPEYIANLEDLTCPELQVMYLRERGVRHPFPPDPDPDTLERLSSYAYVPGHTRADPPDTVIAFEKADNHFGKGRSLLYLDGRGAWEPPENWRNGPPNRTLPSHF